jgi:hypothetical protein
MEVELASYTEFGFVATNIHVVILVDAIPLPVHWIIVVIVLAI